MLIPIKNQLAEMAVVIQQTIAHSETSDIAYAVAIAYENVFSELAEKGEHYIYDGETLQDTVETMKNAHIGITKSILYYIKKFTVNGEFELLSTPTDTYTVEGKNASAGMGEVSPIDASLNFETGGITTPNAKNVNRGEYDATHTRDNYDLRVRAFYEQIIRDNNLYEFVRKHYIQLVYEHNIIF